MNQNIIIGPSEGIDGGDKWYFINEINYMAYFAFNNKLIINKQIKELPCKYSNFIKNKISDIIINNNPHIEILNFFNCDDEKKSFNDWLIKFLI